MADEWLEIIHVRAENQGLAGDDGLCGVLSAGVEKGFPHDHCVGVDHPGCEFSGGVDHEGLWGATLQAASLRFIFRLGLLMGVWPCDGEF